MRLWMLKKQVSHQINSILMKIHIKPLIIMSCCILAATDANAGKSLVSSHTDSVINTIKVFNIDGGEPGISNLGNRSDLTPRQDSIRSLVEAFYYDQFRHMQDPEAPTFLFMSKKSNLLMGIGGVVRMRGWYDWGGAIPGNGFMPYLIPIPENPASMRKFSTTPAGTALFLQLVGRSGMGTYRLYVEANFNGYQGRGLHLKKAYVTLDDLTVGYANSTFSDPAAMVPTVDAQGATNKLAKTDVLIRYMPTFRRHWSIGVSLENPSTQIDVADGLTSKTSEWLPDLAACVQYQWGEGEHVRLSGIVRNLGYRDLIEQRNHNEAGWAVQLSSVAHPLPPVTTYLTFNYGHGYGGLTNDLLAGKYDMIANPEVPGQLYAPRSLGYCIGVQYNFTHALFTSVSFSQTHLLPRYAVEPTEYRYGWCAAINVFWNVLPRLQLAAEFDLGRRMNADGSNRYAKRIGAVCQFSF